MSLFYKIAFRLGFTPWEQAATHPPAVEKISMLFDREESGLQSPYGRALDLGCGTGIWSVELASRGLQVTGIDIVPKAVRSARERAREAGVEVRFVEGDITALRAVGVGSASPPPHAASDSARTMATASTPEVLPAASRPMLGSRLISVVPPSGESSRAESAPAVEPEEHAGNRSRVVTRQEDDGLGDLLGCRQPLQRSARF